MNEQEKLRILITDDSRLLRKKLREELEKLGCEVIEAVNGREAITSVLEQEPDGVNASLDHAFSAVTIEAGAGCDALEQQEAGPAQPTSAAGTNRTWCALSCQARSLLGSLRTSGAASPGRRLRVCRPGRAGLVLTAVSHTSLRLWTCARSLLGFVLPGWGPCEHRV